MSHRKFGYRERRHDDVHWPFGGKNGHRAFNSRKRIRQQIVDNRTQYFWVNRGGFPEGLGKFNSDADALRFAYEVGIERELIFKWGEKVTAAPVP